MTTLKHYVIHNIAYDGRYLEEKAILRCARTNGPPLQHE